MTVASCTSDLCVTFSRQAELWLRELATRKRKPVSPATLRVFGSYVRRLMPVIGEMKLADINNGVLRELVQRLDAEKLSAKTITELISVVKSVVSSLVDPDTGEPLLKREWSARFIDCPDIGKQKQYCATRADVERCIKDSATDQERVLYCLLGGTGLRISECLAIRIGGTEKQTSWDKDAALIRVRATIFNGRELQRTKTPAAVREVDLDPRLNTLLDQFATAYKILPGQFLFQARTGRALHLKTSRQRLAMHNIPGFHCLRRHRITWLREQGVREDIIRYWAGHAGNEEEGFRQNITNRYSKLSENVELRRDWVLRAGLGFALPVIRKAGDPRPKSSKASQASASAPKSSKACKVSQATAPATPAEFLAPVESTAAVETVVEVVSYQATDDDLPIELFEKSTQLSMEVE